MKKWRQERQQKARESKAFREIVRKRTLTARRQAYAEEAEKRAREEGKASARRPSFGSQLGGAILRATAPKPGIKKRRTAAPKRKAAYKPISISDFI